MTALEERLDELIALAKTAGHCAEVLACAEHAHQDARTGAKAGPARAVRDARADLERALKHLERARMRFLKIDG